jgi:hypothetical protein
MQISWVDAFANDGRTGTNSRMVMAKNGSEVNQAPVMKRERFIVCKVVEVFDFTIFFPDTYEI